MKLALQWISHLFDRLFRRPFRNRVLIESPAIHRSEIVEQLNRALYRAPHRTQRTSPQQTRHQKPQPSYSLSASLAHSPLHAVSEAYADHPDKIAALADVAYLCHQQGRFLEAEHLYQRLIELRAQRFGHEHLSTAESMSDLASLYRTQKRHDEAQPLLQEALIIRRQQLGAGHLHICETLYHLADTLSQQQKYKEAEHVYQQTLVLLRMSLGAQHRRTQSVYTDYVEMLLAAMESGLKSDLTPH